MIKKNFTIDRSFWVRGGQSREGQTMGASSLRNEKGNACCLGHIANQCGVPWEAMVNASLPNDLRLAIRPLLYGVLIGYGAPIDSEDMLPNSNIANEAARINDNSDISDVTREAALTTLFLKSGITLTFHGDYLGGFLARRE